jgi:uncharacterized protein DUF6090
MIKFFRHIRQELMNQGKFSKYILYAIGEIFLVVIGILIALQLNTWKEDKKERAYEKKMLTEIQLGIENDILHFERILKRMQDLDSAATHFLDLIYEKAPFIDSLYNAPTGQGRWYFLRTGVVYKYNRGPYESLKSSGIEKISNETLRNELIQLYDFDWLRYEELFEYTNKSYDQDVELLLSFLGPRFIEIVDGEKMIFRKFPKELTQNPKFLEFIHGLQKRAVRETGYFEQNIVTLEEMKTKLEQELKTLK